MPTLTTIATTLAGACFCFLIAGGLAPSLGFAPWQESLMTAGAWNGLAAAPFYVAALVVGIVVDVRDYFRFRGRDPGARGF